MCQQLFLAQEVHKINRQKFYPKEHRTLMSFISSRFVYLRITFLKFIAITLVNKLIWVSCISFYSTSATYCIVCSPSKVKSCVIIYLDSFTSWKVPNLWLCFIHRYLMYIPKCISQRYLYHNVIPLPLFQLDYKFYEYGNLTVFMNVFALSVLPGI